MSFVPKVFYNLFWLLCKLILTFFLHLEVKNKEDLRKLKGPLIVASNHICWADPFLIGVSFPFRAKVFPIRYACWWKYFYFPFIFPFAWVFGSFPVRKGIGLERTLKTAVKILEKKGVVGIFPEGRRQRKGASKPKRGAAFLAMETGAKILPVKIEGNTNMSFWKCLLRRYKVKIKFGKTFRLPSKKINSIEDYNKPANFIMERIREL